MLVQTTIHVANLESAPSPLCIQNWGTDSCLWEEGKKKNCSSTDSALFVEHNGRRNLISSSCHNILKGRDNRQLEIHVREPRIRHQLILFIFYLPPCLCLQPPTFSCHTNYRSTPFCVVEQGFGGTAEGEEILLVLNQTASSILPPSPFPRSLSPPSVFRL